MRTKSSDLTNSTSPRRAKLRLSVILVQYDRQKYQGALQRLQEVVAQLDSAEVKIVVVDNYHPRMRSHVVSEHLVHIAGDNSAWEFSAFDKGVQYLQQEGWETDIYAFVTDAFSAYGDDFRELVNDRALWTVERETCCLGWVDSIMQTYQICGFEHHCHLRTSFLLMPVSVYERIAPLAYPFKERQIFGRSPQTPFRESAPISSNLRQFITAWLTTNISTELQMGKYWHSRFELNWKTFSFFRKKALAILREFILSARLRAEGVPCYDYRAVRFIQRKDEDKLAWQWLDGRETSMNGEFRIDWVHCPEEMKHGEEYQLAVGGWIKTEPQAETVLLSLEREEPDQEGHYTYRGLCNVARPDGLPGFEMRASLKYLSPGAYRVLWKVPGTPMRRDFGTVKILPRSEFRVSRCCVSDLIYDGNKLPVYIVGEFLSSMDLDNIQFLLNGRRIENVELSSSLLEVLHGLRRYQIVINQNFDIPFVQEQSVIEIKFVLEDGQCDSWCYFTAARYEEGLPSMLSQIDVGAPNPDTGKTELAVVGAVYASEEAAKLILKQNDQAIFTEELDGSSIEGAESSCRWLSFDLHDEIFGVMTGRSHFELLIADVNGREYPVKEWHQMVLSDRAVVAVEDFSVTPVKGKKYTYTLRASGSVRSHQLVRSLDIQIDGKRFASFGLHVLRPDLTHDGLVRRQGFYFERQLEVAPGEYEIKISVDGAEETYGTWSRRCVFERPAAEALKIYSDQLEALETEKNLTAYSSLVLEGRIETDLREVHACLIVDDEVVDEQLLADGEQFSLRFEPESNGSFSSSVIFKSKRRVVFKTHPFEAHVRKLNLPHKTIEQTERLIEAFALQKVLGSDYDAEAVACGLAEANMESLSDLSDLLADCDQRLNARAENDEEALARIAQPGESEGERLKVLMGSWEVPCRRHGGGVYVANLLRELSEKHEITLVHAYSEDETGWVEDVKPYVKKLISVPRMHSNPLFVHDLKIPRVFYENYTPELIKALEAELHSGAQSGGAYDLVDYQYSMMFHHMSRARVPKVLTTLELAFTAHLTALFNDDLFGKQGLAAIDHLFKIFHFSTVQMPKVCDHLVTVTQEDGLSLARYQDQGNIYVNAIGVETGRFHSDVLTAPFGEEDPTFTFMGSYRHPPNVKAALFLAEQVMPLITKRYPRAKLHILGSNPTKELAEMASETVHVEGFVKDFRPYVWKSTAFLAPIFTGSGMRVKVLEAMACGCPMVSTALGLTGIGGRDGEHYLMAETAEAFAAAACRCIEDRNFAKGLGERGKVLMADQHSWPRKAAEREAIWRTAIADATRENPSSKKRVGKAVASS